MPRRALCFAIPSTGWVRAPIREADWSVWYAFACVAAAAGRVDESLGYLREAVNRGYKDADGLLAEEDLKELRRNPQFMELTGTLKIASKHGG